MGRFKDFDLMRREALDFLSNEKQVQHIQKLASRK
jgi:hypothetical protein